MAGLVQPLIFPVMWARDAAASFLRTPSEMRALIEAAGFRTQTWDLMGVIPGLTPGAPVLAHNIYHLVMGDAMAASAQAGDRNRDEGRMVTVQAVFGDNAQPSAFTLAHSSSTPSGVLLTRYARSSEVRTGAFEEVE